MTQPGGMQGIIQRHGPLLLIVAVVAAVFGYTLLGQQRREAAPPRERTPEEIVRNECTKAAFVNYIAAGGEIARQSMERMGKGQSSVDLVLAKRRLQETFCQNFVECLPVNQKIPELSRSLQFENCLDDEVRQEVDEARETDDGNDDRPTRP